MRSKKKIRKFFKLVKNLFRILWVAIFIHWVIWAATYARAPHYKRAIEDKKIIQHVEKTERYKDNGEGWLGKLVENKSREMTIDEVEEDILKQIEAQTGKENLPREAVQRLPELKTLIQEIETLEKKIKKLKENNEKSQTEEQKLEKKREDYQKKLQIFKEKTVANIQKQLKENKLNITELNDRRSWRGQLFIDPLKFFLINPFNQICKTFKTFGRSETHFFLVEIIFKVVAVKLLCLWLSYPEWISEKINANYQKVQNPQLSLEEREQSQREIADLSKYQLFGITVYALPWFIFLHPAHLDKTSGHFSKSVPFLYLLIPLLIIFLSLSVLSTESLRLGRIIKGQEIKTFLANSWFSLLLILGVSTLYAVQNWGNYWWILLGFGIDFLFNLVRVLFFRTKSGRSTFRVTRAPVGFNK